MQCFQQLRTAVELAALHLGKGFDDLAVPLGRIGLDGCALSLKT
jgi:hypothetical protein